MNKYKGFALSEVLLAIVVILIVGIGSYALYSNSRDQEETQEIMDTLNQIQTGIDKLIPLGRYHYTGSGNIMKPLIDGGLVDGGQMIAGTGGSAGEYYYLKNGVTYFATVDSTATGQYSYGISAIPIGDDAVKICTRLLPEVIKSAPPRSYITIGYGADYVENMKLSQSVTYCQFYGTHNTNFELSIMPP